MSNNILKYSFVVLVFLFLFVTTLSSQEVENKPNSIEFKDYMDSLIYSQNLENINILRIVELNGRQLPYKQLQPVAIYGKKVFKNDRQRRRYDKLVRDVKKAYPYAKLAGALLNKYEQELIGIEDEKLRKKYFKKAEKELKDQFEGELKNLTITQGRILIKLIDRETGDTSYDLVKQLRGNFSAFMWQSLARLFGSDLKSNYDAQGSEKEIEEIIWMIESGHL